jgi:hypothetical protein
MTPPTKPSDESRLLAEISNMLFTISIQIFFLTIMLIVVMIHTLY